MRPWLVELFITAALLGAFGAVLSAEVYAGFSLLLRGP